MGATSIRLELDDDLAVLLAEQGRDLGEVVRERLVFDLYRRGVVSGGWVRDRLGLEFMDFVRRTRAAGIPYFNYEPDELEHELRPFERP
jgi:hypothetical protein